MTVAEGPAARPRRRRVRVIMLGLLVIGMLSAATWALISWLAPPEAGPTVCRRQVIITVPDHHTVGSAVDAVISIPGIANVVPLTSEEVWEWYQSWRSDPDRQAMAELIRVEQMTVEQVSPMVWIVAQHEHELQDVASQARSRIGGDPKLVEVAAPCRAAPR